MKRKRVLQGPPSFQQEAIVEINQAIDEITRKRELSVDQGDQQQQNVIESDTVMDGLENENEAPVFDGTL